VEDLLDLKDDEADISKKYIFAQLPRELILGGD
jgi:hypothetical protein